MMKYKTSTPMIKIKNTKLKKGNQENTTCQDTFSVKQSLRQTLQNTKLQNTKSVIHQFNLATKSVEKRRISEARQQLQNKTSETFEIKKR